MEERPTITAAIPYAPAPPRHRRLARRWLLPAVAAGLLASASWWGPPAWFRVQLAYFERQCAGHTAPPETIVYTESAADAKQLVASPSGYEPGPTPGSVFRVPGAWSAFYRLLSPPGLQSRGTAFLHERRTPDGRPVLIAVDYLGDAFKDSGHLGAYSAVFHVRAFEPGRAFTLPVEFQTGRASLPLYTYERGPGPLRLRAGQPDPADPTHFTIAWEVADDPKVNGVIDGWVRARGVELERR
jgi:hypothetical protein